MIFALYTVSENMKEEVCNFAPIKPALITIIILVQ